MSIMEKEIANADANCAKCLGKCQGCSCRSIAKVMNTAKKMEKEGTLSKEDKEAYFAFMRG